MTTFSAHKYMKELGPIDGAPQDPILLAMGFLFAHEEDSKAIIATHNPDHLKANIDMLDNELPILPKVVEELHRRFDALGEDWPGIA